MSTDDNPNFDKDFVEFLKFTKLHNRTYRNMEEFLIRFAVFMNTAKKISEHNTDPYTPDLQEINQFADHFVDEVPEGGGNPQAPQKEPPIPNTTVDEHFQSFFHNINASEYWKSGRFVNLEEFLLGYRDSLHSGGC